VTQLGAAQSASGSLPVIKRRVGAAAKANHLLLTQFAVRCLAVAAAATLAGSRDIRGYFDSDSAHDGDVH